MGRKLLSAVMGVPDRSTVTAAHPIALENVS
jgi:hypothetical protein